MGPCHFVLAVELASVVPVLLNLFEVHSGTPVARPNLGRRSCDSVPRTVHA